MHSLALKSDGTVVAWGYNYYGQTNVPSGLTNVVAIAGGYYHSLALKSDGTVVAWGYNDYGQTNVPSGLTNVVAIAGGVVSQSGAQERRHGGCLGRQRLRPDQCSLRPDERGGDCRRWVCTVWRLRTLHH